MNKAELLQAFSTLIDPRARWLPLLERVSRRSPAFLTLEARRAFGRRRRLSTSMTLSPAKLAQKSLGAQVLGRRQDDKATPNSGHYALERWISEKDDAYHYSERRRFTSSLWRS